MISLRAGARLTSRVEPGTIAAGFGLRWDRLRLDYITFPARMNFETTSSQLRYQCELNSTCTAKSKKRHHTRNLAPAWNFSLTADQKVES